MNSLASLDAAFARRLRPILAARGGSAGCSESGCDAEMLDGSSSPARLSKLVEKLGPEFASELETNREEHEADCLESCQFFYCADGDGGNETSSGGGVNWETQYGIRSYSMGAVPPEDFASDFRFPLDLIKVTSAPLFDPAESSSVVSRAEEEGLSSNEYRSGKYKLGGDWIKNLPSALKWFNGRLRTQLFPLIASLFPEVVTDASALRAHSVSLLKYNASHPRTDVHVDNGILAMTLAMTPSDDYVGGGTFFEHMGADDVLEMDVGHGTFRPGSVRHGGHKVDRGTRYILGAFLLIRNKVEHVRRMKNRGADYRKKGDLERAQKLFSWALEINPKCTTCLKDWAELLQTQKKYPEAETKLRRALHLLEGKDSDALFSLGVLLSQQNKDDESIQAYRKSVALNADDAELCYNLGIKLGAKGDTLGEQDMYAQATKVDPNMAAAWLNWGTSLAEQGDVDLAEPKFLKAVDLGKDDDGVRPKAMINLSLVYQKQTKTHMQNTNVASAAESIGKAGNLLEKARTWIDAVKALGGSMEPEDKQYVDMFGPLRLQCHQFAGRIYSAMGEFQKCEAEFRAATEGFPNDPRTWFALGRVLEHAGKAEEAKQAMDKMKALQAMGQMGL
uniref:Fe2OG dioxygenase domain-containing protein n=1 Tax=Corethron hystrix TaxID=216773 RepID=A0A7S1BXP3_9STRA